MNRRYSIIILAIVLIIASISIYFISTKGNENKTSINFIEETKIENFDSDKIFKNLPPKHPLFELIVRNFLDGEVKDFTFFNESVWKRPEFYPTWKRSGIPTFTEHQHDRWGVHGYGFYPSEEYWGIQNMGPNSEFVFYSWFHSSWGVETWQGIQLMPIYNEEYFDVKIEPNLFLIGPTYPIFDEEWVKLIKFTVTSKDIPPIGLYTIGAKVVGPSIEQQDDWSWALLDKYTEGTLHTDIERCKENSELETCDNLITQRQVRYVQGGVFSPTKLFECKISIE